MHKVRIQAFSNSGNKLLPCKLYKMAEYHASWSPMSVPAKTWPMYGVSRVLEFLKNHF
jgi:hypothetical protein